MPSQQFTISPVRINRECSENICQENAGKESDIGKLSLLHQWLYDHPIASDQLHCRMAPSLIVRSEAELFGVSSPRFAIRVRLSNDSFINIRRRNVLGEMIKQTVHGQVNVGSKTKDVREILVAELKAKHNSWVADSLLVAPSRLLAKGFRFLETCLSPEYGEPSGKEMVPYVTQLSIGGGLCAQAACFMSLCLTNSKRVLGISEITRLASPDDRVVKIHGLNAESIARFFAHEKIGLDAQLQAFGSSQSDVEAMFISTAIKAYIRNGIPLNVMVSVSRMQGFNPISYGAHAHPEEKPILTLNGFVYDKSDHSMLPIGLPKLSDWERTIESTNMGNDNHCVVIVGVNDDSVCLNDPATFPFLEATFEQLIDAKAYAAPKSGDKEIGAGYRHDLDQELEELERAEKTPGVFQMVSVTPNGVHAPLLNPVKDGESNDGGLLQVSFDVMQGEWLEIGQVVDPESLGDFFLAYKSTDAARVTDVRPHDNECEFPQFDFDLVSGLSDGWYWLQQVGDHPTAGGQTCPQLWFWDASLTTDPTEKSRVLVLENRKDVDSWMQR